MRAVILSTYLISYYLVAFATALAPQTIPVARSSSKQPSSPRSPATIGGQSTGTTNLKELDHDIRRGESAVYADDESDSSRRLFFLTTATMVGAGLWIGTGGMIEPANAATAAPAEISSSTQQLSSDQQVAAEMSSSTITTSAAEVAAATAAAPVDWKSIAQKASKRALGGGKAGASAAVVQVCSLMWLRTSMNYQYRYGGSLGTSLKTLWEEGGVPRLYQGLPFALVQGPMTRFGDTAANVGILALLDSTPATQALPLPLKTACGSAAAGLWRIVLMPVDTSKTAMQVEGADGLKNLWNDVTKISKTPAPLYRGAFASAAATAVGHYPWFLTYNFLNEQLPEVSSQEDLLLSLARAAFLGLSASCVSDVCSNSLRVIKTTKQTANLGLQDGDDKKDLSYREIVSMILEKDGITGLLGRGLQTRLLTNAIQGSVFSVLWKYFQQVQG